MRPEQLVRIRANAAWRRRARVAKIKLIRTTRVADGAGGWNISSVTTLPEQTFRIAATARQHDQTGLSTMGEVQEGDWLIVGPREANVQKGDTFEHEGSWWRVKFVDPNREWRTSAAVVEHGPPS